MLFRRSRHVSQVSKCSSTVAVSDSDSPSIAYSSRTSSVGCPTLRIVHHIRSRLLSRTAPFLRRDDRFRFGRRQPFRRSATSLSTTTGCETFQGEDCLIDGFLLGTKLRNDLDQVHGSNCNEMRANRFGRSQTRRLEPRRRTCRHTRPSVRSETLTSAFYNARRTHSIPGDSDGL